VTRLFQIRARVASATEAPWKLGQPTYLGTKRAGWFEDHHVWSESADSVVFCNEGGCRTKTEDVEFAAAARQDVPFLLSLVEDLAAVAQRYEWSDVDPESLNQVCPECWNFRREGHQDSCALAAVLRRIEE